MNRILVCAAYYLVASRRYSSQGSKGYAKLSQLARMRFNPGHGSWADRKGSDERNAAAELLWARRQEIRAIW